MRIPAFAAETFEDSQRLTRMQAPTRAIVSTLRGCPLVNGVMIQHEFTGAVIDTFAHKLGRVPVGWLVIDCDVYTALARPAWDAQTITIDSFAACNVTFWIF